MLVRIDAIAVEFVLVHGQTARHQAILLLCALSGELANRSRPSGCRDYNPCARCSWREYSVNIVAG